MKNILIMTGVGVGLFSATVVGLLGVQGRLNYEGTRGVPLLSMFFAPSPASEGEQPGEHGEHGEPEKDPHGEAAAHTDDHSKPFGVQHDGLGVEERLEYAVGKSALNPEPEAKDDGHGGGHGGDHGDEADAHADDHGAEDHGNGDHATDEPHEKLTPPKDDFEAQMEALYGQDRYRRGEFFKFPRLEGDITVTELNQYLRASKLALEELEKKRSQLDAYAGELDARERDIEDRERQIAEQMAAVDVARAALDKRVAEFRDTVLLVRRDESEGLRKYAETLASFEPKRAMQHVIETWDQGEEGRNRILKVLSMMKSKDVNAILQEVELPRLRDILVQRLKVVHEGDGK
ncbi:MAG: hypothetical protein KDB80_13850 [Planctomycetes bacterium]|nr:hypothetical protein [Planctomycetota bacterium]